MKWPRLVAAPIIAAVSFVLLLSAVILGVSLSSVRMFPPFGSPAQLGKTLDRTSIAPLSDRFIEQVLGSDAASAKTLPEHPSDPRTNDGGSFDRAGGEVVDHALTNDDRAAAYEVTRLPFTARTSTTEADREAGEPGCGTELGGTVWYRYTATRSEALLADTFGTDYQTSLAVYLERPDGSGPLVACDSDNTNSEIKIDTTSETTYLFQIAAAVRGGPLTFHLRRVGETTLASLTTTSRSGDADSYVPSVSSDGRYVAFSSLANNLDPEHARLCAQPRDDAPGVPCNNVFLRDRKAGTTSLVSVGLDGTPGNSSSGASQISDDGRYVVFWSSASDLVAGDRNELRDIFLRDIRTGRTEIVSLNSGGEQALPGHHDATPGSDLGERGSLQPALSADGRYIAFDSTSPNLVAGDNDDLRDTFVRDRLTGTTRMVSVDSAGGSSPTDVFLDSISRDGRWIVFITDFPMSADDTDLSQDVFVRDLWTDTTELVSLPAAGSEIHGTRPAAAASWGVSQRSISDDGRFVVFGSDGALVGNDTNAVLDVFVRDRLRRTTERVSVTSSGAQGVGAGTGTIGPLDGSGGQWAISGDGRRVAFASTLNLLEPGDDNSISDVYVHDRADGQTLRISGSGNVSGGSNPRISGDGMTTAFDSISRLTFQDTNAFADVYVFSSHPAGVTGFGCSFERSDCSPVLGAPITTSPCGASAEYVNVGTDGAHEDVQPPAFPSFANDMLVHPLAYGDYPEDSVVRFRYRIDASGSATRPAARSADVRIALNWDNRSDFDLYIYTSDGQRLASSNADNNFTVGETMLIQRVPHCTDLWVDVVNFNGLPTSEMSLVTVLGGRE